MKSIDRSEHLTCRNYDNGDDALLKQIVLQEGEHIDINSLQHKLLLIDKGLISYTTAEEEEKIIPQDKMLLVKAGSTIKIRSLTNETVVYCFKMGDFSHLCDVYALEKLLHQSVSPRKDVQLDYLPFVPPINLYIKSLQVFLEVKARCYYLHEMKIKELLYLLRLFYSKEELLAFLLPILSNDMSFSHKVFRAAPKARTVKDLADATGLSTSGFNKHFKKVFKMSPYMWLQEKRINRVSKYLTATDIPLKEIVERENFANQAELNRFCTRYMKKTPLQIRE